MMRLARTVCLLVALSLMRVGVAGAEFSEAAFPLRVAEGGRHLEDARGRPFLIHGDAGWSLIAELAREETELYLADRKARGFNAIIVSLIERKFATNAPANADGEAPFTEHGRFAEPNDLYFDHAEWVLRRANEMGFLVLLVPAYLGFGGGEQGWYAEMEAAGAEELHAYGRYLGRRFGGFENILWLHGGDYDARDRSLVRAVVDGLAEEGAAGLSTVHSGPDTITVDYWPDEPWLDIDTVYTYSDVHRQVLERYQRQHGKPILMLETAYEGEHGSTPQSLREAAYGALLAGAAGHIFGNNPIWHFSGPGIYAIDMTWQEALASPGAVSMRHVRHLFEGLAWWELEPDEAPPFDVIGQGRVISATTPDRGLTVAYLAGVEGVHLDTQGAPPALEARWYDPAAGRHFVAEEAGEGEFLRPPAPHNSDGDNDWVLLLQVVPQR